MPREMPLATGTIIQGRYCIVGLLAESALSRVYDAYTPQGRHVVLREMVPASTDNPQVVLARFLRNARTLRHLHHPSLPVVHDAFLVDWRFLLVMDFVEGASLAAMCARRGPLPEDEVRRWLGQLCDVLDYLSSQHPPIVVAGLKPGDIIVQRNGLLKLVDFGLAHRPMESEVVGSDAGREAHTHALGALAWALLTGRDPAQELGGIRGARPASLLVPGISPALDELVRRSLTQDLRHPVSMAEWRRIAAEPLFGAGSPSMAPARREGVAPELGDLAMPVDTTCEPGMVAIEQRAVDGPGATGGDHDTARTVVTPEEEATYAAGAASVEMATLPLAVVARPARPAITVPLPVNRSGLSVRNLLAGATMASAVVVVLLGWLFLHAFGGPAAGVQPIPESYPPATLQPAPTTAPVLVSTAEPTLAPTATPGQGSTPAPTVTPTFVPTPTAEPTATPAPTLTPTPTPLLAITPILECVTSSGRHSLTAFFGYDNPNSGNAQVPVGGNNYFSPDPQDRGQPTTFQPGRQRFVFSVSFTNGTLTWNLTQLTASASSKSPRCLDSSARSTFQERGHLADERLREDDRVMVGVGYLYQVAVRDDLMQALGLCCWQNEATVGGERAEGGAQDQGGRADEIG